MRRRSFWDKIIFLKKGEVYGIQKQMTLHQISIALILKKMKNIQEDNSRSVEEIKDFKIFFSFLTL